MAGGRGAVFINNGVGNESVVIKNVEDYVMENAFIVSFIRVPKFDKIVIRDGFGELVAKIVCMAMAVSYSFLESLCVASDSTQWGALVPLGIAGYSPESARMMKCWPSRQSRCYLAS